ncbi:hypothetical protein RRG08_061330 [Elysia crispata]|uniref:Uncharacterized protein n=1 Tax=Elysia crispata TaxID=231223 RepID=A0AAE1DXM8_9GAST|nr:hypothetical protein RRG08_061330 [Elysia crispata]
MIWASTFSYSQPIDPTGLFGLCGGLQDGLLQRSLPETHRPTVENWTLTTFCSPVRSGLNGQGLAASDGPASWKPY